MSDEKYVGAIAAAKQAVLIKAYVDSKMKKDFVVNITFDNTSAPTAIGDSNIAVFTASTDKTFAEISSAVAAGKNVYGMWNGHKWPLYLSSQMAHAFRGSVQLDKVFGNVGLAIANCVIDQNGCTVTASAGELPAPALDGSDDGKGIVVSGHKWTMKKAVVDDAMSATSTNPVQNKVVKAALDGKASTAVATTSANGLMSAADKAKLDGVEDGATKTVVDDAMSDTSTNPVQNKVVMEYIDSRGTLPPVSTQNDTMLIQVVNGAYALRTKESIFPVDDALDTESKNAVENGIIARRFEQLSGVTLPATSTRDGLMTAANYTKLSGIEAGANKTVVDAALDAGSANPVQNKAVKAALDGKAGTAVATTSANGLMSAADKTKLNGVEEGATKTIVDDAMSATSTNPVQNKAVKAALDGKLDKTGGTVTGNLRVTGALFSGDGLSFGAGENIHFTKVADDAGKLAHGAADVDDTVPLARLKVAAPTEDDDAATKAYVDNNAAGAGAVRYDAAQTLTDAQKAQARENVDAASAFAPILTSPVMIRKEGETASAGVYLSTISTGEKQAEIKFEDVNENGPVAIANLRTPTGAGTDNYAATKGYVDSKVASSGGGVTPTIGTNGNWYISNTDTGKPSRGATGAKGDAGATGPAGPTGPAGAPGKDGAGMDITGATVGQIAKIAAVDASGVPTAWSPADMPSGGSPDVVLYTPQTLTDAQKKQVRENIDAASDFVITATPGSDDAATLNKTFEQILAAINAGKTPRVLMNGLWMQLTGYNSNVIWFGVMANAGNVGEMVTLSVYPNKAHQLNDSYLHFMNSDGAMPQISMEADPTEPTQIATKQYVDDTAASTPLVLTYANNQATGASYSDIRKAIESGRQIKLSVANTLDIIASNARNETNKSVLRFTNMDVGGDTVNIAQYNVTAQASGLTANVKSYEIAQ